MKKSILILGCFLMTLLFSCSKVSKQATNSAILGRWILVSTLVDPGDGSGKYRAVDIPNFYYLQLNADSTVATNCFLEVSGANKFGLVNDSVINFMYTTGQTGRYAYHLDDSSLTITGGCFEPCGSKFIRSSIL